MFSDVWDYCFNLKFGLIFITVNVLVLAYHFQVVCNCLKSTATGKLKHVLITGCDSGFGYKTVLELNASKVIVYAACLTDDGVKRLQENPVFKGIAFVMDVTKKKDIDSAYTLLKEKVGAEGLACLISNAGILNPGLIDWQPIEEMQECMNVNLWGAINVIKTMLPLVKMAKGRFVNVTSMAGRVWFGSHTAYSMSKYAFEAFSDGLRYEMKQWGLTVHIVEPGICLTPILNIDRLKKQWTDLWNKQNEDVKEAYGTEYFQQVLQNIKEMIGKLGSTDIKKVTDAICHATLSSNPKSRYVIGFDAHTIWMAIAVLPTFIGDYIMRIASKVPVPAAMKKITSINVDIFRKSDK